jgi:hypothetical protein
MSQGDKEESNKQALADYQQALEELQKDETVNEDDIAEFKKQQLLMKSVGDIKKRAQEMKDIRASPSRYNRVHSKVNTHNNKPVHKKKATHGGDSSPVKNTEFGTATLTEKSMSKINKREDEILAEEAKLEEMRSSKGWRPQSNMN